MPGRGVDPAGHWLRTELGLLQTGASGWALPDCAREGCAAACARPFASLSPRPYLLGHTLATKGQRVKV